MQLFLLTVKMTSNKDEFYVIPLHAVYFHRSYHEEPTREIEKRIRVHSQRPKNGREFLFACSAVQSTNLGGTDHQQLKPIEGRRNH